ncbi:MAG TPA: hypothetical protein VF941_05255 [Clostridia bacterium]
MDKKQKEEFYKRIFGSGVIWYQNAEMWGDTELMEYIYNKYLKNFFRHYLNIEYRGRIDEEPSGEDYKKQEKAFIDHMLSWNL